MVMVAQLGEYALNGGFYGMCELHLNLKNSNEKNISAARNLYLQLFSLKESQK